MSAARGGYSVARVSAVLLLLAASLFAFQAPANVDVTILQVTPFGPYGSWQYPFETQWFGETAHAESNIPGSNGTRTPIYGIEVQWESDNQFKQEVPPNLESIRSLTRYRQTPFNYANRSFEIWTG